MNPLSAWVGIHMEGGVLLCEHGEGPLCHWCENAGLKQRILAL